MTLDANIITRDDANALIPVETSREIIKEAPLASKVLPLMRRLPNMTAKQRNIPIATSLANAYFLNGTEPEQKKTTKSTWGNSQLTAEELAVIVPIPEAVLDDADYDIWGEVKPQIVEALGLAIDNAILFGVNKPASWASAIVPTAITKGNEVALGTVQVPVSDFTSTGVTDEDTPVTTTTTGSKTKNNIILDIVGEGGVMSLVEKDGYRVNGFIADSTLEAKFRSYKESYIAPEANGDLGVLAGRSISFDNSGYFDLDTALLVGGDFSKAVYAIRQDITYKVLTEAVIFNTDGTVAYNLAQQDMVALRVVMRLGVQVAVPATRRKGTAGYPFAVLAPAA
ncbi:MAG: phage major capsid protein [Heliobacteriaceae bacterium]|jgi:hypothetical protein|nr:phage major capsid protein [Heliobacteriaceae bacterium]